MAKSKKSEEKGKWLRTREEIEKLNKEAGYEAYIHHDDLKDISTGGFIFANKEAKEKFKKAAININPKTKDEARNVQSVLLGYIKLIEKYPKWVRRTPQYILDRLNSGKPVYAGKGDWLDQNKKKYDEQQRAKRRAYYLKKKQEKQQNSK